MIVGTPEWEERQLNKENDPVRQCLCDPGDIISGICDDCREDAIRMEEREEQYRQMRKRSITEQPDGQMVLICR